MGLLLGDVGGTNVRLAMWKDGEKAAQVVWPTAEFDGLWPAIERFVGSHGQPEAACLAVAAPVRRGVSTFTNLGWTLDSDALAAQLRAPLRVINDFHAQASATRALGPDDWEALQDGDVDPDQPAVVLGAGTGLGEALVVPTGGSGFVVVPGEGGHTRFAPRDEREIGLLRTLTRLHGGHVSVERVLSGQGLIDVYDHLRGDADRHAEMADTNPAAVISRCGLDGSDAVCAETLEVFCGIYGDEAANLALQCNAGVVWVTGGIAPRVLPALRAHFPPAFVAKGRYRGWLASLPVRVVTHPDPGLLGARVEAEALLR